MNRPYFLLLVIVLMFTVSALSSGLIQGLGWLTLWTGSNFVAVQTGLAVATTLAYLVSGFVGCCVLIIYLRDRGEN